MLAATPAVFEEPRHHPVCWRTLRTILSFADTRRHGEGLDMIREGDVQWWVLEAQKHPEAAPAIIGELARRLFELDSENERLRDEAVRLQTRGSEQPDAAEVADLRVKVAALQRFVDETHAEYSLILISDRSQTARLGAHQVRQLALEGGRVSSGSSLVSLRCLLAARTSDYLLLLSSLGRGSMLSSSDIPAADERSIWPVSGSGEEPAREWLAAATTSAEPPRFRTVVTRRGFVRQYIRVTFDRALDLGQQVLETPLKHDEARAIVDGDAEDLLVVSRWGRAERFPQRSIAAQGSMALELGEDDEVVAALPLDADLDILIVTAAGLVARRSSSAIATATHPGGSGKRLIQAFDVLAAFPYEASQRLLFITYSGSVIIEPLRDVPLAPRSAKGLVLHDLSRDPAVAVVLLPSMLAPDVFSP